MQRQHGDFLVLQAVARNLAALAEEDEPVGAVPVLDDIQTFMDLPAQRLGVQVAAEKDRLDRLAQFGERSIGRMLQITAGEAPENRLVRVPLVERQLNGET